MKNAIEVQICGRRYVLKGDATPEHAGRLAAYVDEQMRKLSASAGAVSSLNVAVLAALNIAEELFKVREEKQLLEETYEKKASNLIDLLSREMDPDPKL
ncbi:MAG: cell division protein ZapA [Candidatus Tectomicrobia bacterium]|uniref:Cell division protein ZapA n=1 Tax=Tectimicrobiota bacterium TaxID=2528274 RepID=A0A932GNB9_UNCTE|nr:cell division protein ZapA [Candidatus Tectomicrobia bacterium]